MAKYSEIKAKRRKDETVKNWRYRQREKDKLEKEKRKKQRENPPR